MLSKIEAKELGEKGQKKCSGPCKRILCKSEFHKNHKHWDKLQRICKACASEAMKLYHGTPHAVTLARERIDRNTPKQLWGASKVRAKKHGIENTLLESDISIPEFCPVLGIKLQRTRGKRGDSSPSLDRIDPAKGYVRGNIAVISWRANELKKNGSADELEKVAKWVRNNSQPNKEGN